MQDDPELPVPDLSDLDAAFPANALEWMPAMDDVPEEFKRRAGTVWSEIVSSWFVHGLPEDVEFYPRKGVDPEKAFRAIQATLGSHAPRHEHKEAAAAYMLSRWFAKVENWEPSEEKKARDIAAWLPQRRSPSS